MIADTIRLSSGFSVVISADVNCAPMTFNFGIWKSTVASRVNADGTNSFVTIDPARDGIEFTIGERDGKRVLLAHDFQHDYVYVERR
jgi:hypothetical protein